MTLKILPLEESMAPQVAHAFNRAIDGVPHCHPLSAEEYLAATRLDTAYHGMNTLHSQNTVVALTSGRVVGMATAAQGTHGQQGPLASGQIRMLWYERGHRLAGQSLLEAAEGHLTALGHGNFSAFNHEFQFPGYHFTNANLTDRWDHVHGLLGISGYRRLRGEVFLDWPDLHPPDPGACPIQAEIRIESRPGKGSRADLAVRAVRSQREVGACLCWSGGEFSAHPAAQDWVFVRWLWVDEPLQGLGMGRYLLLRALVEARVLGYAHSAISTDWSNHRAMLLYANTGYRAVDWTSMYHKGAVCEPA